MEHVTSENKPKPKPRVSNPNGRPRGSVNRVNRVLKDAILEAAAIVGSDKKGRDGLLGFLVREAMKADNRGFMGLMGKVLPLTVAFDKNRPLEVLTRIELVRPPELPRDVTPPVARTAPPTITLQREPPPAPRAPVRVRPPGRSGS